MSFRVPFNDLHLAEESDAVREAIARVVDRAWFVLGPEVEAFEREFAAASGAPHAVGVGNGTDAIALILRALGIGPGDEVITTPLSAAYTAIAIVMVGARPVFADIDPERLTLDPGPRSGRLPIARPRFCRCICTVSPQTCQRSPRSRSAKVSRSSKTAARRISRHPQAAPSARSEPRARSASTPQRISAPWATAAPSSPATPLSPRVSLGCATEDRPTGIVTSKSASTAGSTKCRPRFCARGFRTFGGAQKSGERAPPCIDRSWPALPSRFRRKWMRDTCIICFRSGRSTARLLQDRLSASGIETLVHYPTPISQQPAFAPSERADCPQAVRAANEVLSLPLYPGLSPDAVTTVAEAVRKESSS